MKRLPFLLVLLTLLGIAPSVLADRFGDLTVVPQSFVSGETHHGYREFRILLENQSERAAHRVTLILPEHAYSYGNSISRLSRTVSLEPMSRAMVSLWQPPLPIGGDNLIRVVIDEENAGSVNLPGNTHMTRSGSRFGGAAISPTVLVSRGLNFDDWTRSLKLGHGEYSAVMATGAPDSRSAHGMTPTAWMPDNSSPGPHWLELDFDKPIQAGRVDVFETMGSGFPPGCEIILTGISGTNMGRIPITLSPASRPGSAIEFSLPPTAEPVKSLRFNFGAVNAGNISIDAVGLENPARTETVWASSARASSESSTSKLPGSVENQMLRAEVPVSEWSDAWLTYSPFDGIAVSAAEMRSMPPAVQTALWRYTECGGNLLLMGDAPVPEAWRASPKTMLKDGESFDAGFGRCIVLKHESITALQPETLKSLTDAINNSARFWQSIPDQGSANGNFPVIENVRVPVRGIVFIMLIFVIAIGPVNLIVLSRMKRRTWLLWTIPAISLFTSLVVFAYSMVREGITADVRLEGVTLLDQGNRRAATQGATAFYCPLTPSQGLFFGSETEATPLVDGGDYRSGAEHEVDWTQSQHLQRGWVAARVPAHFYLRKSETRRERLQLESAGAQWLVVNGLGTAVRSLWLADKSGKIFTATNLVAGQKVELIASKDFPQITQKLGARALAEKIGFTKLAEFNLTNAPTYLLPGTYIAELDSDPFLENGLGTKAKSARSKVRSLIFGILETTPQP